MWRLCSGFIRTFFAAMVFGVTLSCNGSRDLTAPPTIRAPGAPSRLIAVEDYYCFASENWDCYDQGASQIGNIVEQPMYNFCYTNPDYCHFTDGPTGGGSYANPSISPPSETAEPVNDALETPSRPTCSQPANNYERAWCAGSPPSGATLTRINSAINRMRNLGGVCATLADIVDAVVNRNPSDLRVFPADAYSFGGGAPVGGGASGSASWMVISDYWTTFAYDDGHNTTGEPVQRNLQQMLAHEADHLNGEAGHADAGGYTTTNSQHCGGF